MMRLTMAVWWSLALVWLLSSRAGAGSAPDQAARRAEVIGDGLTVEGAKQIALERAVGVLRARLHELRLDHWRPTEKFVQFECLDGPGQPGADEQPFPGRDSTKTKTWVLALKIPADETLQQLDRQAWRRELSEERMSFMLRVVAALVLGLASAVGCIRVDEWTHSRYTPWLRLASGSVFVAVVAAWWWLR
jgi:hypothetical protein